MGRVVWSVYVNIKCRILPCAKWPCRYERKIELVGEKHESAKKKWNPHPQELFAGNKGACLVNTKTVSACLLPTNTVFNRKFNSTYQWIHPTLSMWLSRWRGKERGWGGDGNQQKRDDKDACRDSRLTNTRLILFSTDTPTTPRTFGVTNIDRAAHPLPQIWSEADARRDSRNSNSLLYRCARCSFLSDFSWILWWLIHRFIFSKILDQR